MAKESGMHTPTNDGLPRMDQHRKGKKASSKDWESPAYPEAKVALKKNGRNCLACKPEQTVDLDTGAVIAVGIHPADQGDTKTLCKTLKTTKADLENVVFFNGQPRPLDPK